MNEAPRLRRLVLRAFGGIVLLGLAVGLYFAYVWAGASSSPVLFPPANQGSQVTVRLEEAPFSGYFHGHKSWSLWAKRIDLEHLPGSAMANIQSATLTDIRNGKLFDPPPDRPTPADSAQPIPAAATTRANRPFGSMHIEDFTPTTDKAPDLPPAATFRADRGVYSLGTLQPVPSDLQFLYEIQWQFKLQGNVDYRMRSGDRLHADSLIILEMINKRTRRTERRVLCDTGVQVTLHGVKILANQARYDPADRTVECLGGVRGAFKDGTVQADQIFWSLKDQMIRCPETATGTFRGMDCTWKNLTVDLKRRKLHADTMEGLIRMDKGVVPF